MSDIRMQIEFYSQEKLVHTTILLSPIPNLAVGQIMVLDHPIMDRGLKGKITNIQHVVYLGNEAPITYVDVTVD